MSITYDSLVVEIPNRMVRSPQSALAARGKGVSICANFMCELHRKVSRMTSKELNIINGPNKFDLMVSLFEGNPQSRKMVVFVFDGIMVNEILDYGGYRATLPLHELPVAVTSITQEDGSGESWIFQGWSPKLFANVTVAGFFSSRTRKGRMKLTVK